MSELKRDGLVEIVADNCGNYKKGDVTFGYNVSPTEQGFAYLTQVGAVVATKEKSEKVYSTSVSVSPLRLEELEAEVEKLTTKISTLEDEKSDLEDEKAEWEKIKLVPDVAKAIAAIKP